MPKCRIHGISWRDDEERCESFSCPLCDRERDDDEDQEEESEEVDDDGEH